MFLCSPAPVPRSWVLAPPGLGARPPSTAARSASDPPDCGRRQAEQGQQGEAAQQAKQAQQAQHAQQEPQGSAASAPEPNDSAKAESPLDLMQLKMARDPAFAEQIRIHAPSLYQDVQDRMRALGDYDQARAGFVARQPMGRLGTAEEVAQLVVFLASDESAFMTGDAIVIDGGWSNA